MVHHYTRGKNRPRADFRISLFSNEGREVSVPSRGQLTMNSVVPRLGAWEQGAKDHLLKKSVAENAGRE